MKKKIGSLADVVWRQWFIWVGAALTLAALLWYRLGSLVPSMSDPEIQARIAASSGKALINNPLFLPHKLLQYLFIKLGHTGAFWMRLPSTLFALLVILAFYRLVRTWYSTRVAVLSTLLFITSAWFLHYARLGTPEILYACSVGLLWAGIRLRGNASRSQSMLICVAIAVLCLYIPIFVWFVVPIVIWQRKAIFAELRKLSPLLTVALFFAILVALAPLIYGLSMHPSLLRSWLGIPLVFDQAVLLSNVLHLPLWFTARGPVDPVRWLGHVPFLDALSVAMFILGAFVYSRFLLLDRVRVIVALLVAGAIFAVLNGPWQLILITPIMYVVVASGLALLLQQWFTVFPRNPLARWVGIVLVALVVSMALFYNLTHYFVAWPKATDTKRAFHLIQ